MAPATSPRHITPSSKEELVCLLGAATCGLRASERRGGACGILCFGAASFFGALKQHAALGGASGGIRAARVSQRRGGTRRRRATACGGRRRRAISRRRFPGAGRRGVSRSHRLWRAAVLTRLVAQRGLWARNRAVTCAAYLINCFLSACFPTLPTSILLLLSPSASAFAASVFPLLCLLTFLPIHAAAFCAILPATLPPYFPARACEISEGNRQWAGAEAGVTGGGRLEGATNTVAASALRMRQRATSLRRHASRALPALAIWRGLLALRNASAALCGARRCLRDCSARRRRRRA